MSNEQQLTFSLLLDMDVGYSEVRKLEATIYRALHLMNMLGLGQNVNQVVAAIQKIVMNLRMAQATIHAFEVAAGPIGWAYFGVSAAGFAVSTIMSMSEMGSDFG
jgi:uncharacterized protein YaaW (UPF0174 family)